MSHPVSCQLALRRTHLACRSRLRRRRPCRFDNPGLAVPGTVVTPVTAPAPGDRPAPLPLVCRMSHPVSCQLALRRTHLACRSRLRRRRPCRFDNPGLAVPGTVVTPVTAPAPGDRPAPLPLVCRMSHPVSCQLALRRTHLACRSRLRRRRPCRFDNPGLAVPGTVVTPVTAPAPGDRPAPLPLACRMSHLVSRF